MNNKRIIVIQQTQIIRLCVLEHLQRSTFRQNGKHSKDSKNPPRWLKSKQEYCMYELSLGRLS